jgi:hypothetical protein
MPGAAPPSRSLRARPAVVAAALDLLGRSPIALAIVAVASPRFAFVFVNEAFASQTGHRDAAETPVADELARLLTLGRCGPHTEIISARRADGTTYRVAISVAPLWLQSPASNDSDDASLCVVV